MLSDEKVIATLKAFETVEWQYDGLGGQVIKWTNEHGNTNPDPIEQMWVLDAQEKVIGAPTHGEFGTAAGLVRFLEKMLKEWKTTRGGKEAAPKKMLVKWSEARLGISGDLEGFVDARQAGKPVLGYMYIPESKKSEKKWKPYFEKGLKFEGEALADKDLAKLAEECLTVRFDYTDEAMSKYLKDAWNLKGAPQLFLIDTTKKKLSPRTWKSPGTKAINLVRELKKILKKE